MEKSGPQNLMLAHGYAGLDHAYKNQRECVELAVALGLDLDAMIATGQKFRIFERCPDSHPHEAKTLIPLLADEISDEDLQEHLDDVSKLMPH
ncbi:hypothetical protein GGR56DRAFT_678206 [Xylariaceae sp. FL0804]|nr:hypothetical protein GGR56DRAFT_678206 [Xylariaceae sp. FL0804]